jgi:hypothetical protein
MYLVSIFPPFAISLVQSTISSNANGLFGLDPPKKYHLYFLDSGAIAKQCNAEDFRLFSHRPHLLIMYRMMDPSGATITCYNSSAPRGEFIWSDMS